MEDCEYKKKDDLYEEVVTEAEKKDVRKFKCKICSRVLSSKQRILTHLHSAHDRSPLKKVKKLYLTDPTVPVPKRTLYSWKANARSQVRKSDEGKIEDVTPDKFDLLPSSPRATEGMDTERTNCTVSNATINAVENENTFDQEIKESQPKKRESVCYSDSDDSIASERDGYDSSSSSSSSSSESDLRESSDDENQSLEPSVNHDKSTAVMTESQLYSLSVIAYILRHNLTGIAGNDLLKLFKAVSPKFSTCNSFAKFEDLLGEAGDAKFKVCHYCPCCNSVFPENADIYQCETLNCQGLRYKGGQLAQTKSNRQPNLFFLIADVQLQLKQLLEQNGLLEKVYQTKQKVKMKRESGDSTVMDIIDGKYYRMLCEDGQFLADDNCISGIFNTDGIPLYNSSKVKLWPIFLAVNEIPLNQRFSRENMILVGIWQGKGNPPFLHYLNAFSEEMCKLYNHGVTVNRKEQKNTVNIKLGIFLGSVDLQAKGYVLNMTMHNGEYGCSTCEEPGMTVEQGKGHAHCYPYRERKKRFPFRKSDDLKFKIGPVATDRKRIKGTIGISGLMSMPWFDIVLGIVPDYMHGVLMGVTKTLLFKWFSSTKCNKPFFIGKYLTSISRRLKHVKPPDYIERLPRDLEKHYAHLKATELQAWLLYYALPCVNGYLPAKYLKHFACLSEGIHLLLGDHITEDDLDRAEKLLDTFYRDFAKLYGEGSCGLNVHNTGAHLVFFVRLWGPLYSWSCFGFEDWNAILLQSAHGTGNVTNQMMWHVHAQLHLKNAFEIMPSCPARDFISKMIKQRRQWKISLIAKECSIAGGISKLTDVSHDQKQLILNRTRENDFSNLQKVLRIQCGKERFYSKEYKRMKKRICYAALTKKGEVIAIQYFIYNKIDKTVFALAQLLSIESDCFLFNDAGHHVIRVSETTNIVLVSAAEIQEKLFFVSVSKSLFVIRMCNIHGHGLLK